MGVVMFYHLTRFTLEEAALPLLNGALSRGWNVMLRGPNRAALEALDLRLWQRPADGFLPHGLEGGAHDRDQPILLGQGAPINGAKAVLLLGGMSVDAAEAATMERVWLMFEGADPDQLSAARAEWKAVTAAGLTAQYWADGSGRWEKKAEAGGGS